MARGAEILVSSRRVSIIDDCTIGPQVRAKLCWGYKGEHTKPG